MDEKMIFVLCGSGGDLGVVAETREEFIRWLQAGGVLEPGDRIEVRAP